jgi:hypothetical protein
LEGDSFSPPFEWLVSRVCEEFHCLPSQAVKEIMNDPLNMAFEILELRAYAQTKEQLDNLKKGDKEPTGPVAKKVWEIQQEIIREEAK